MVTATAPIFIAAYCTVTSTSGTRLNGISMIGFMITGRPKRIGSLILKMEAPAPRRATSRIFLLRAKISIAITSDSVAPAPPIQIISKNCSVIMCGGVTPAWIAAMLSV